VLSHVIITRHVGLAATLGLYAGGAWFKSRSGHLLLWDFLWFSFSTYRLDNNSIKLCLLSTESFMVQQSVILRSNVT
jgi:hypothetical protein